MSIDKIKQMCKWSWGLFWFFIAIISFNAGYFCMQEMKRPKVGEGLGYTLDEIVDGGQGRLDGTNIFVQDATVVNGNDLDHFVVGSGGGGRGANAYVRWMEYRCSICWNTTADEKLVHEVTVHNATGEVERHYVCEHCMLRGLLMVVDDSMISAAIDKLLDQKETER